MPQDFNIKPLLSQTPNNFDEITVRPQVLVDALTTQQNIPSVFQVSQIPVDDNQPYFWAEEAIRRARPNDRIEITVYDEFNRLRTAYVEKPHQDTRVSIMAVKTNDQMQILQLFNSYTNRLNVPPLQPDEMQVAEYYLDDHVLDTLQNF